MLPTEPIPALVAFLLPHMPLVAMVAVATALRRSLGAWPVYLAVLELVVVAQVWLANGDAAHPVLVSFAGMMTAPTLLFVLARRQCIPGLRRGTMSPARRLDWVARHAFRPDPASRPITPSVRRIAGR